MKKTNLSVLIILLVMAGCGDNRKSINQIDDIITVDVKKTYPKKELILQNFMDVEYVALETNDEFVCQGIVLAVGKDVMLVNNLINDGNLYIFERNGKGLRKINRKGNGSEEYIRTSDTALDEDNSEIFVNNVNKILVYDLFGNFKRSFPYKEGYQYANIRNFDAENLICNNSSFDKEGITDQSLFVILSKKDGSIKKDIQISYQQKRPSTTTINHNGMVMTLYTSNFPYKSVIFDRDSWIFSTYSSDTVFRYLPDHNNMVPFMIRTPSIESNNPESFLYPMLLTERYYFLQTEKIEPEIKGTNPVDAVPVFPKTDLIFDRQEKSIYEYTVYNEDYTNKITVGMMERKENNEIAFWQKIEAHKLVEAYKNGEIKGKLKDIAAELEEESNPVIMLVKYKK